MYENTVLVRVIDPVRGRLTENLVPECDPTPFTHFTRPLDLPVQTVHQRLERSVRVFVEFQQLGVERDEEGVLLRERGEEGGVESVPAGQPD
jgi:hypothetical protein